MDGNNNNESSGESDSEIDQIIKQFQKVESLPSILPPQKVASEEQVEKDNSILFEY
jgi:hypothetical protein